MEQAVVPVGGLSQVERVVDVFVAPSKTFTDIRRSASWWLPFLLATVMATASAFAIDKTIGFTAVAEQSIHQSAKSEEQMAQMEPAARARQIHGIAIGTKFSMYASGLFILVFTAFFALLNWAGFNFILGAQTTYGQNFALAMYGSLPRVFLSLLNIVFLYTGVNTENFDLNNPVGTNVGYYLTDAPHWIRTMTSFFDVFGIWSLVLMVIGGAIISGKSKGQAAMVIVGWWFLGMVILTAVAAVRG